MRVIDPWSAEITDSFIESVAEIIHDGWEQGVIRASDLRFFEFDKDFNDIGGRVLAVLDRYVDKRDAKWCSYYNPTLKRIVELEPGAVLNAVAQEIHDRAHNKPPREDYLERWDRGIGVPIGLGHELSPQEQKDQHAETIRQVAELRARFETILEPYEKVIAEERLRRLREEARMEFERVQLRRNRPAPSPQPQPFGVSNDGAERLVCGWMRHLGNLDAEATRQGADGGVDVESEAYVAQVKNYRSSVGVEPIRELFGVAAARGKQAIFFTSGSYTTDATRFADVVNLPLLKYDPVGGTLTGENDSGRKVVQDGLPDSVTGIEPPAKALHHESLDLPPAAIPD